MQPLVIALILMLAAGPAYAAPTVLVQLGSAPLLGKSNSTDELRLKTIANDDRMTTAAILLGMSPTEYRAFHASLMSKTPGWGVLPRHLSAMAFYGPDNVRVLHDVIIPAHTYGWEVDVDEPDQTVRVLIPASCGNLSIIRHFHPVVAARAIPPESRVAAAEEHAPPSPSPTPVPEATPAAAPSPSAELTPAPVAITPPETTATSHRFPWLWFFPIALLFFHGHDSGHGPPPVVGGGCGCGCDCNH